MLAVHVERERLAAVLAALVSPPAVDQPRVEVVSAQDHERRKRGYEEGVSRNGDIELRPMISTTESRNDNGAAEPQ